MPELSTESIEKQTKEETLEIIRMMLIELCVETTLALGDLLGLSIDPQETVKAVNGDNVMDVADQLLNSYVIKDIKEDEALTYRTFKLIQKQEYFNSQFKLLRPLRNILIGINEGKELVSDENGFYLIEPASGELVVETTINLP